MISYINITVRTVDGERCLRRYAADFVRGRETVLGRIRQLALGNRQRRLFALVYSSVLHAVRCYRFTGLEPFHFRSRLASLDRRRELCRVRRHDCLVL